jgi:hypothetical protein
LGRQEKRDDWQITNSRRRSVTAKTWSPEKRPFHRAYLAKKLPCPNQTCSDCVSAYSLDGIDHHCRTIHKMPITQSDIDKAKGLNEKHSEELTLNMCLKEFSEEYKSKVIDVICVLGCYIPKL